MIKLKSVQNFKIGSVFSGAGGLDSAFSSKFNHIFANDILSEPSKTFCRNHGFTESSIEDISIVSGKPIYIVGDASKIKFKKLGSVDCIIGGAPCQDFSLTRGSDVKRKGILVKRGQLYLTFLNALKSTNAKLFVFENVPGLMSANKGLSFKTIKSDFEKEFHLLYCGVVNSADLGVAQLRKRLIIIGIKKNLVDVDVYKLNSLSRHTLAGDYSLMQKYPLTTMEIFEGKSLLKLNRNYKKYMKEFEDIPKQVNTEICSRWTKNVWNKLSFDIIDDYLFVNRITPKNSEELNEALEEHDKVLCELGFTENINKKKFSDGTNKISNENENVIARMQMIPPNMNHMFVRGTKWGVKSVEMSNIYRRIHPLKPSYTVIAYGGGGTWGYHYQRDRSKLTNRERARIQSFPDDYYFEGNISQVRAQIGESVPYRMGQKISGLVEQILLNLPKH